MPRTIRQIRIDGNIAFITLTMGYEAVIDADDIHLVADWNWSAHVCRRSDGSIRTVYARRKDYSSGKQRTILLHRAIVGTPEGLETDHKDCDGLNNRRDNLRDATPSQNTQNMRPTARNTSGVKGVYWNKGSKKWHAQIMIKGKSHNLGLFETIETAAVAYAIASAKLHGEFGRVK